MKTRKIKKNFFTAICVIHENKNNVKGVIKFTQKTKKSISKAEL